MNACCLIGIVSEHVDASGDREDFGEQHRWEAEPAYVHLHIHSST